MASPTSTSHAPPAPDPVLEGASEHLGAFFTTRHGGPYPVAGVKTAEAVALSGRVLAALAAENDPHRAQDAVCARAVLATGAW